MARLSPMELGLLAGTAGTAALCLSEIAERKLSGGQPLVYAPTPIAARLVGRTFGRCLRPGTARRIGRVMRWVYGPSLGAIHGWLRARLPVPFAVGWLALASGIYLFELVALPATGATPRLVAWASRQPATLALHTAVFALLTEFALRALSSRGLVEPAPGLPQPEGNR